MKPVLSKLFVAVSYISIWIIIYFGMIQIFSDSPSRVAYGLLSGWWAALCFSLVLEIKIKDLPLIMVFVVFISFLGSIFNKSLSSFLSNIDELVLFLSPMILSSFIYLIKSKYKVYRNKTEK
ncbi:MAG: hypothetical protein PHQ25_01500 [Acidobacteriota bacterium]|nr:hypothetical protein [Acidobacteriota bacterium]MDW3228644.1 hypothetical protein [Acidobacteriota bacterium]